MTYPLTRFDPCHDGFGTQLGDNSAEMLQVIDLEINGEFGEIRRPSRHADIVDIAVMLGDHGGDLGEASGLVDIVDQDSRRKRCGVESSTSQRTSSQRSGSSSKSFSAGDWIG